MQPSEMTNEELAKELIETVGLDGPFCICERCSTVREAAAKHVECHIVQHRMAEVRGECLWAEACFGDGDAFVKVNDKEERK